MPLMYTYVGMAHTVYVVQSKSLSAYVQYAPQRAHQMYTLYQRYLLTVLVDIRSVQCVCTILCIQKYVQ